MLTQEQKSVAVEQAKAVLASHDALVRSGNRRWAGRLLPGRILDGALRTPKGRVEVGDDPPVLWRSNCGRGLTQPTLNQNILLIH
jgi:hypothetical protein